MAYNAEGKAYPGAPFTTTNVVYALPATFPEEHASKYRCCCNSTNVAAGAKAIGIIQIIACGLSLLGAIINFAIYDNNYIVSTFVVSLIFTILQIVVAGLMLYGISVMRESLILPELIFEVIGLIGLVIGAILAIVTIAGAGSIADDIASDFGYDDDYTHAILVTTGVIMLIAFIIAFAFSIWFFMVILRCYQYIKAKNHWLHTGGAATHQVTMPAYQMQYQPYTAPPTTVYPGQYQEQSMNK